MKDKENNQSSERRLRRYPTDGNLPALIKTRAVRRKRTPSASALRLEPKASTEHLVRTLERLMDEVPEIKISGSELRRLGLDHRGGYLLSLVDGELTLREIRDVSGMPRAEILKTLTALLDAGAIAIR